MNPADPANRVLEFEEICALRRAASAEGRSVVLTNGCFDLLHRGHISYLEQSAALGDILIVAVNSDASVRALKGADRPVNAEQDRAYTLAALRCVDAVFVFPGPRLDQEITELQPDHYTKAGDYTLETLDQDERAALERAGTTIHLLPFVAGHSTTSLIQRASQR